MARALKTFMRNKKPMWHCWQSKCLLLNSWRCNTCGCDDDNLMNWLSLDEPMLMSAIEETPVEAPKKKRSKKKKVEEVVEENVDDIPEVLSLDELSK